MHISSTHPGAIGSLVRTAALATLVPLFMAACSGGGGGSAPPPPPPPPPPSNSVLIYGTAAAGAAVAGTVTIEDATGRTAILPVTAGSGAFSASVDGMTAPFMLKVASSDGATVLYSAIPQAGRANITPLTSLALLRIAASYGLHGPADLYAQPGNFAGWDTAANLTAASSTMLSRLMPAFAAQLPGASSVPQTPPSYDPFGTAWTVGAGVDLLLDAYPVTFTTDNAGVVTALQTDHASGLAVDVARSDTASQIATGLAITGAGQGTIVGGTSAQFGAQAHFTGDAQQAVSASWSVSGLAGASVDSNGKVSVPAVDAATSLNLKASWFDGIQASVATIDMTVVPAMRPLSLEITGASPNAAVAAGASLALGATVHWSDGSTTTPAATWSFTGDATAVPQLGSDGLLRAGKPGNDTPIVVTAAFSQAGVPVSGQLALTVSHFVRRVQSVSLTGLAPGQVLTAGDHADLTLTALWNDGSESTLAPTWASQPASGATNHIATSVSAAGKLTTASYYVPTSADAGARAAESDLLKATYDKGDGTLGELDVPYSVKPLVNIPTALEIRGPTAIDELSSANFLVWVDYADGSSAQTDAAVTSQDTAVLAPSGTTNGFSAAHYDSKPATPLVATLSASRTYAYQDANGQPVSVTLSATHAVEVDWVEPALIGLSVPVDHLATGTATPVPVTGLYTKFDVHTSAPLMGTTFSVDSALVSVDGNTLTATQAPATLDASWITLTVTGPFGVTLKHVVTLDLAGTVPKRLLAYPWSPLDTEVQFRAIASDGDVDDYTVTRSGLYLLGYESAATRRRLRLVSGATDFVQSAMNPDLTLNQVQETQYVAAVEHGQVVVLRHDDLMAPDSPARPVVLPGVTNASRVALVARRDDGSGTTAAVRLYVLDQLGTVRQYKLPYVAAQALAATDVQFERQLAGSFAQISGGADFILLKSTGGSAYSEGASESDALGDPANASHWNDTFAMQYDGCDSTSCAYLPFDRAVRVYASVNRSFVARSDAVAVWGDNENALWNAYTGGGIGPDIGVTSLAAYAWIQGDGSVHFQPGKFASDGATLHDLNPFNSGFPTTAGWLPAVSEVVDGRRPAAALQWSVMSSPPVHEYQYAQTMAILRTTADTLVYLDGRVILDPQGQPIVLP